MPSNSLNNEPAGSPDEPATRLNIREELAEEWDTDLLFLSEEEFDEAIIGVAERIGQSAVVAYDTTKLVEVLSRTMSVDEAYEYFEFNILGAYVGERTPMFVTTAFKQ
jgi:hypothetical protein